MLPKIISSSVHNLLLLIPILWPHGSVDGGNILVISPALSRSLVLQMGRLADVLVLAGHNVTVWIPEMQTFPENGTKLAQRVVRTRGLPNMMEAVSGGNVFGGEFGSFKERRMEDEAVIEYCEELLKRKDELAELKSANFDLAFTNFIELCFTGIVHHLGIRRHIFISTGPIPDGFRNFIGIPSPLSVVPMLQSTSAIGPRMNVWERICNIWQYALSWYSSTIMFRKENALFHRHISPEFPALEELATQTDLVLINGDEFMEPAFPTLSKVLYFGGLGISADYTQLKPAFRHIVESPAIKGVVLLSLGSVANTTNLDQRKWGNLLRAFAHFRDYAFIVRANAEDEFARDLIREMPNIHLFDWLPQTDLLAHPKTRLLISHAGSNSLLEAGIFGVPLLAIPLFFDQLRNAKCAEYRGNGRLLDKNRDLLDMGRIKGEIQEMLSNSSYKLAAERLAKLYREKPFRPEQVLVQWTQFVLSNGPLVEFVPESARMPLLEYLCLDIAVYGLIAFLIVCWLVWRLAKLLFNKGILLIVKRRTSRQQKPKKMNGPARRMWRRMKKLD